MDLDPAEAAWCGFLRCFGSPSEDTVTFSTFFASFHGTTCIKLVKVKACMVCEGWSRILGTMKFYLVAGGQLVERDELVAVGDVRRPDVVEVQDHGVLRA